MEPNANERNSVLNLSLMISFLVMAIGFAVGIPVLSLLGSVGAITFSTILIVVNKKANKKD